MSPRPRLLAAAAAAALVITTDAAPAQTFDPTLIDRHAEERAAARGPQPPIQSMPRVPPQVLHRPADLTVCMSAPAWSPIYAEPDQNSPVVGYAVQRVAMTKRLPNGFTEVLLVSGKGRGYLPSGLVTPYRNPLTPGDTCTVALAADGRVLFR